MTASSLDIVRGFSKGLLIFMGGLALGIALTFGLSKLSEYILPPEAIEDVFGAVYSTLPWVLPALLAVILIARFHKSRWLGVILVIGSLVGQNLVLILFAMTFQGFFKGPPNAAQSLFFASPQAMPEDERPLRYSKFDADELNRRKTGWKYLQIQYVPATVPSTGPLVVSVNPIDDDTWGAAALSLRGHCNLQLLLHDPPGTNYGYFLYGRLPQGSPCVGAAATRKTATSTDTSVWLPRG